MKTLTDLSAILEDLALAVEGPEPWGRKGFYAADFEILTNNRGDYETLVERLDGFFFGLDTVEKTVEPGHAAHEATTYLIGENSSWGLSIRIVGPMCGTTRQYRIVALEAELAQLKAGAA